ncbi:MAG: amidohydrolase [Lachnospiraceae bacterium]|nr:amidohydrolase [Lachnospiraceae bacterium]
MNKYDYLDIIDEKSAMLDGLADYIWDNPELNFREYKSSAALIKALRDEGFEVETGIDGMETAFSGSYGSGRPVIGILGEFDALAGLNQEAGALTQKGDGTPGHGCGHNLLGVGSLAAAMAVKKYLESHPGAGTVIYYGCPAEEGGSAKAFMARDGVFDGLDAALTWHPANQLSAQNSRNLANCKVLFKFDGIASHAALTPQLGRSALDAVELMNVGANYLREHVKSDVRFHYAVTDPGGAAPGVVQAHAEVLYLIRAPKVETVMDVYRRICNIAKGAALMTETTESHVFLKAVSSMMPNQVLVKALQDSLEELPVPQPSEEDLAYYRELTRTSMMGLTDADPENPLFITAKPLESLTQRFGSTDVADVSRVCPTAQITGGNYAKGTPGHTWLRTAQGKTDYAHSSTRYVGKALARTAVRLMEEPELLAAAQAEYRESIGPDGFVSPIPADVKPSAD